jgi:DNA-binding transcriptional LysR family regulator
LDAVARSFPNVGLRIAADWSSELLERLRSDGLDAALVLLTEPQLASREVELRSFSQDEVVVIAARRTPMPSSPAIAELGLHPWILNPRMWIQSGLAAYP